MLSDYFLLALKNVRKRGIRSWLTMLGIFIGIAAVVSLISLGQGLETAITGQFGSLSTDTLTLSSAETGFGPPGATAVRKLTDHDLELVEQVPGVKLAIPRLVRITKVDYNEITQFRYLGSMPENKEQIDEIFNSAGLEIAQGRMLKPDEKGKIVIGDDFVSQDSFDKEIQLGSNLEILGKNYEVVGILKKTSTFVLNSVILMQEDDMRSLMSIGDEIDIIAIKVQDADKIEQVAQDIERKLRKDRNQKEGEEDFSVQTPLQALSSIRTILTVINIVVTGIAAIALLVGGIGITNTMFTSVLERTRENGVMKAIGAQNKDILTIFLIESALLGLVGGLVGAAIGLSMALGVAGAANSALGETIFKVSPSIPLLIGAILFSLVIGILSGLVPAYQASKLNPVEALRK